MYKFVITAPGNFFKYHQDQCHDRGEWMPVNKKQKAEGGHEYIICYYI